MGTVVTVLFGSPGAAVGWVSEENVSDIPPVGTTIRITFHVFGNESSIDGQVYRAWDEDDAHTSGVLIYGGTSIPDVEIRNVLETAGWEPLSDDTIELLAGTIHESPTIAALHEVNLFVGEGENLRLYRRTIEPSSPILPVFGQRMRMAFVDEEFENEFDVEPWGFATEVWEDDADNDSYEDDFRGEVSDAEWRTIQEKDRLEIDMEIVTGNEATDPSSEGVPLLVFYAALVEPGLARLAFWTTTLGNISEFDLLSQDWESVEIPTRFDPEEFDIQRRLELALATHVIFESNNYDSIRISDWWIDIPDLVDEADESYLPPYLYEWAIGVQQLDRVDEFLEQWKSDS